MSRGVLAALLAALFAAFAFAAGDAPSGSNAAAGADQIAPPRIADDFRATILAAARENELNEKAADRFADRVSRLVLGDENLERNHGVNRDQMEAAESALMLASRLFKVKMDARDPRNHLEKRRLDRQAQALQRQFDRQTSEERIGPLASIFDELKRRIGGRRPAPGLGGSFDDVIFGPIQGGLMAGALDAANGRYDQALADYQKVAAAEPKNADAVSGISAALLNLNRYGEANQAAKRALELDPGDRNALAVLHFSAGRIDGAAASGPSGTEEKGLPSVPGGASPSGGEVAPISGEQARKAAEGALAMGDLDGAMALANRALARDPRDASSLNLRSSIHARRRDYARAAADAQAGLAFAPRDTGLLRSLGFARLRSGDDRGAMAAANEILELDARDPYAYAIRAHAYGTIGDRDAMLADLGRAAELDQRFAPAAARMANQTQPPQDADILFLFPGEEPSTAAKAAPRASGRARSFAPLAAAGALGGLLLALAVLAKRPAAPAPALIRGQYEISRQIGAGGMGMVFAGTDRSLGRLVAIKKMRAELRDEPREKARFVAEAKTVAALRHPGIVDIYAIVEDGDDVFLVFEYVDGTTVSDLLRADGRLEPGLAARIVRASADALEYAHASGVVHRDMKPSNVMIDASGRVKVMDFGIARAAKDTLSRRTMTNSAAGTPPYMAPEQEQGRARAESDVYALAVCAYEMLTGKLPFAGSGAGMLMNKINMSYVSPSREAAGLPAALDAVFARALEADPDKRCRTPGEFADALESALSWPARA